MKGRAKATDPLVRPDSLSIRVASRIREELYQRSLEPGAHLRELALAKEFRVSQATIREALACLEHQGLVIRVPNRSTTVVHLRGEDIAERTRVWCNLEQLAAREAAMRAEQDGLRGLEEVISRAMQGVAGTFAEIPEREFHLRLWQLAENRTLCRTLDCLTLPLFVFRLHPRGDTPDQSGMHRILHALRSKDAAAIVKAVAAYHGMDGPRWHSASTQSTAAQSGH
jgi:DNA-binding GntR family transcriptional regulator